MTGVCYRLPQLGLCIKKDLISYYDLILQAYNTFLLFEFKTHFSVG